MELVGLGMRNDSCAVQKVNCIYIYIYIILLERPRVFLVSCYTMDTICPSVVQLKGAFVWLP